MLRVYLDQNHWVSLTKARVGHKDGERFVDALLLLREAVDRGWVSLPLSIQHAMELQHRSNWQSRCELAGTMIQLSRWHAIARDRDLIAAEIDRMLRGAFGRPIVPRTAQVFGVGINHMMGLEIADYEIPPDLPLPPELQWKIQRFGSDLKEVLLLTGLPPNVKIPGYEPEAGHRVAEEFAQQQEELREMRRPHGFHKGDRGRRATSVDVFAEFESAFTEALKRAGLNWSHIYNLKQEGMELALRSVPSVFVHRELRRLRHEASVKAWEESDLVDLTALSTTIVYCDVVVTERVWTDLADRAKLGERLGTTVLRNLDDLVPHLIGAAQAA
jgi:hypothetical protein